jgi:hypothetical protein
MADTVSTITILNGPSKLTMKFLNKSDGTGESGVKKVDLTSYTGPGQPAAAISSVLIEKIVYDIKGMQVQIIADGTSPVVLANLSGFGHLDYKRSAGLNSANAGANGGNIKFTTIGAASGNTYDITLFMRKQG